MLINYKGVVAELSPTSQGQVVSPEEQEFSSACEEVERKYGQGLTLVFQHYARVQAPSERARTFDQLTKQQSTLNLQGFQQFAREWAIISPEFPQKEVTHHFKT